MTQFEKLNTNISISRDCIKFELQHRLEKNLSKAQLYTNVSKLM